VDFPLPRGGCNHKSRFADINPQPNHFVLEAVQNADDNDYLVETPMLNVTYLSDTILITSNEKGFTNQNVKSICDINESTKSGRSDCTGDKGIDFKSFFKIALAIHISSRRIHLSLIAAACLA
jgi:hypothetical protein